MKLNRKTVETETQNNIKYARSSVLLKYIFGIIESRISKLNI